MPVVRTAKLTDHDGILALLQNFGDETKCFEAVGGLDPTTLAQAFLAMQSALQIWIVEDNKTIVAALGMIEVTNPFSGLKGLEEFFWYSLPQYRGCPQTLTLISRAEDYAHHHNIRYVTMTSMTEITSPRVERYFESRGFTLRQRQYIYTLPFDNKSSTL